MANAAFYFDRFGYCDRRIKAAPDPRLRLAVVVPCCDEPDLIGSLESLSACRPPDGGVEAIVVINESEACDSEARRRNDQTERAACEWAAARVGGAMPFHILRAALPPRAAGVGLARKIGMDEAARRFEETAIGGEGVILCFDADCRCDENLLAEVDAFFRRRPSCRGASVYFEHPLAGSESDALYRAIASYELHLRYYVEACRFAGHPHAFHTVGSCMAARSEAYMALGGMNRRKAGEDFYFLQKVIQAGPFGEIVETCVRPSPRVSRRVPFGTGRAVGELLAAPGAPQRTRSLRAFQDLKVFFRSAIRAEGEGGLEASPILRAYLDGLDATRALAEIRGNTAGAAAFRKRFFRWFNAFQVMKFAHFARARVYEDESVEDAAEALLRVSPESGGEGAARSTEALLAIYRRRQRRPWTPPCPE